MNAVSHSFDGQSMQPWRSFPPSLGPASHDWTTVVPSVIMNQRRDDDAAGSLTWTEKKDGDKKSQEDERCYSVGEIGFFR